MELDLLLKLEKISEEFWNSRSFAIYWVEQQTGLP